MEKITGLSKTEVAERVRDGKINSGQEVRTKSFGEVLRTNLVTPFNILNLALAAAVLLVRSPKNALFMCVVLLNAIIGTFQEIRAKRLMDRLSLITAPKATVIRDGKEETIALSEIVIDDILLIRMGQQVGADAILLEGTCEANESMITGEQDPIAKNKGDELISGSFIVAGPCYAKVVHVGADNYAAKITKQSKYLKKPQSEIMDGINKIIKFVSIIIIPLGLLNFFKTWLILDEPIEKAVLSTVSGGVGMIPEGLVLLTSVALSVGAIKLARKQALVQELYSLETLARVDVLCLDKTGTITTGDMALYKIKGFSGYSGDQVGNIVKTIAESLGDANATAQAILKSDYEAIKDWEVTRCIPFSSSRKYSGICVKDVGTFIMGSAENIYRFSEEKRNSAAFTSEEEKNMGMRAITVAHSPQIMDGDIIPDDLRTIGQVFLFDEVRENAKSTLDFFDEQGVDLKVISGDDVVTVSNIAKEAGLEDWKSRQDATELRSAEECADAITKHTIFGRVDPWQKFEFIKALKSKGHTVAMTGDGVNDVMALKESDCGIAMAAGSDAARNVSKIVLMDSDFASMPEIVKEGRRCINNLQRSSALFLSKTLFSVFAMVFFLFASISYPMQPIQFTLINALTIGTPSVVLALLPNDERVKGNFLKNILKKAIPGAATNCVVAIAMVILERRFGINDVNIGTVMTLLVAFVNFLVLFKVCMPFDIIKIVLFITMVGAFIGTIVIVGPLFGFVALPRETIFIMSVVAACLIPVYSGFLYLVTRYLERDD